ncbi:MAG: protein kinase [Planctomycetes bacterium]|nr:protein kinase [Planctomycetota bacterium]
MSSRDDISFGELAVRLKYLSQDQLREALIIQQKMSDMGLKPKKVGDICIEKGWLDPSQIQAMLAVQGKRSSSASQIAGYKVIAKLGKGSMGSVYKARQLSMDRIVAIKTLSPNLAKDPQFLKRFLREARSVARLNHENIIAGYDVGESNGIHYFVMEFVDGPTVSEVLMSRGPFPEREALIIIHQVARALEHASEYNIIHRDIKPDNIMVSSKGVAKLCDLGLAKMLDSDSSLTQAGHSMGTPHYISPEQAQGLENIDSRSDIYSLGATLYHMIAGRVPYPGNSPVTVMTQHVNEPLPSIRAINPAISEALESLIGRMMMKNPAQRFQNPTELRFAIEALLASESRPVMNVYVEDADLFEDEDETTCEDVLDADRRPSARKNKVRTVEDERKRNISGLMNRKKRRKR